MKREIITVAQMRAIDSDAAAAGVSTRRLMENAGRAVAAAIMERFAPRRVAVLCGPGNNGGDGWVAARALAEAGWLVTVHALVGREHLTGDAAEAAAAWSGNVAPLESDIPEADLFVDALFGAGLSRPLEGALERLSQELEPSRVVAIDVPSGYSGDDAEPLGEARFRAALTVTFVRKKPAHVLSPSRNDCGEVIVADIGVPESVVAAQQVHLYENDPSLWTLPRPKLDAHKHARGHVVVASGGHARTGAARLSASGALRAGAGLVTVLSPSDALAENAAHLTAVMLREATGAEHYAEAARNAHCMVIGPAFGTSDAHYKLLCAAIDASPRAPLVLDADALTVMAPLTRGFTSRDVLTPHVGEFRRAFPGIYGLTPNRIEAARAAAAYARCVVLLKGPDTVVAAPDGRAIVNTTGTPFLATAGSGDVLAGIIGGLIAQGMDSFAAACAGAWMHGRAAQAFGPGLIAEDLPELLPGVLSGLAS